jgi:hypothetical protein
MSLTDLRNGLTKGAAFAACVAFCVSAAFGDDSNQDRFPSVTVHQFLSEKDHEAADKAYLTPYLQILLDEYSKSGQNETPDQKAQRLAKLRIVQKLCSKNDLSEVSILADQLIAVNKNPDGAKMQLGEILEAFVEQEAGNSAVRGATR